MYCMNCGNKFPIGAKCCPKCGRSIGKTTRNTAAAPMVSTISDFFAMSNSQDAREGERRLPVIAIVIAIVIMTVVMIAVAAAALILVSRGFPGKLGSIEEDKELSLEEDKPVRKLVRENYYGGDGSLKEWSEYSYDSVGNQTKKVFYDADDTNRGWTEFSYDSAGNQTKMVAYKADGTEVGWYETSYDSAGNQTKTILYHVSGIKLMWDEYSYDSMGNQTKTISYKSDGSISGWYETSYDSAGNQTKKVSYSPGGSISGWYETSYDSAGNKTKEVGYNADGTKSEWTEYIYEDMEFGLEDEFEQATGKFDQVIEEKPRNAIESEIPTISTRSIMLDEDFEALKIRMGYDLSGPYDGWRSNSESLFCLKNMADVECYMNISSKDELLGVKNGEIVFFGIYGLSSSLVKVKDLLPDDALTTEPAVFAIRANNANLNSYVWKLDNGYMAVVVIPRDMNFYNQYVYNVAYVTDLSYLSYIEY